MPRGRGLDARGGCGLVRGFGREDGITYVPAIVVGAFVQNWLRGSIEEFLVGIARVRVMA